MNNIPLGNPAAPNAGAGTPAKKKPMVQVNLNKASADGDAVKIDMPKTAAAASNEPKLSPVPKREDEKQDESRSEPSFLAQLGGGADAGDVAASAAPEQPKPAARPRQKLAINVGAKKPLARAQPVEASDPKAGDAGTTAADPTKQNIPLKK